jgi:hypothetical protein
MNTAVCRKCGVEHDARDVKNGICFWCEQKEARENQVLQSFQYYYSLNRISNRLDSKHKLNYNRMTLRG